MNETRFNESRFNQSAFNGSLLSGSGAGRQAGFFPPGTPRAIREAMVCWYDPARQGCTNESMAANPVLRDLSGNGHDLACHNFAWSGMSGIGGYAGDFTTWKQYAMNHDGEYVKPTKLRKTVIDSPGNWVYVTDMSKPIARPWQVYVTGITDGLSVNFRWNDGTTHYQALHNGVNDLPAVEGKYNFYSITYTDKCDITIEILPWHPGALVSDGVDDYAQVTGLPVLTDYTVIAKRDIFDTSYRGNGNTLATKSTLGDSNGAFQFERINANDGTDGTFTIVSFGGFNRPAQQPNGVSWMTSESYNGTPINKGTAIDSTELSLLSRGAVNSMKCALYSFILFDRTLSAEEIEWVKDNMVNGYPSPVVHYDCSKYTNADMGSNPVLEDLSGNGHDLELHNFAFAGMSGFGGDKLPSFDSWNSYGIGDYTIDTDNKYKLTISSCTEANYTYLSHIHITIDKPIISISGIPDGITMQMGSGAVGWINVSNGTFALEKTFNDNAIGIRFQNTFENANIIIEILPKHPGGLVFDGVDDYGVGSRGSFDKCTLFMLFKPISEPYGGNTYSLDMRAVANRPYTFAINRVSSQIAYNMRNDNGTYINNVLNKKLISSSLEGKKHLVCIKGDVVSHGSFVIGKNVGNNLFDNMVLYKFLLFDKELTQKQIDKVIQDYQLMDDVDDVWNEQQ